MSKGESYILDFNGRRGSGDRSRLSSSLLLFTQSRLFSQLQGACDSARFSPPRKSVPQLGDVETAQVRRGESWGSYWVVQHFLGVLITRFPLHMLAMCGRSYEAIHGWKTAKLSPSSVAGVGKGTGRLAPARTSRRKPYKPMLNRVCQYLQIGQSTSRLFNGDSLVNLRYTYVELDAAIPS